MTSGNSIEADKITTTTRTATETTRGAFRFFVDIENVKSTAALTVTMSAMRTSATVLDWWFTVVLVEIMLLKQAGSLEKTEVRLLSLARPFLYLYTRFVSEDRDNAKSVQSDEYQEWYVHNNYYKCDGNYQMVKSQIISLAAGQSAS